MIHFRYRAIIFLLIFFKYFIYSIFIPIINIGTRQQNRAIQGEVINTNYSKKEISAALKTINNYTVKKQPYEFGEGNSAKLFLDLLLNENIWKVNHQKQFRDI